MPSVVPAAAVSGPATLQLESNLHRRQSPGLFGFRIQARQLPRRGGPGLRMMRIRSCGKPEQTPYRHPNAAVARPPPLLRVFRSKASARGETRSADHVRTKVAISRQFRRPASSGLRWRSRACQDCAVAPAAAPNCLALLIPVGIGTIAAFRFGHLTIRSWTSPSAPFLRAAWAAASASTTSCPSIAATHASTARSAPPWHGNRAPAVPFARGNPAPSGATPRCGAEAGRENRLARLRSWRRAHPGQPAR